MWVSTSKGKMVRAPSAADLVGALLATGPDESVVVLRDLMHFLYVARHLGSGFALWIRDGAPDRQVRVDYRDAQDVAAAMIAFATNGSFAREIVETTTAAAA